MKKQVLLLTAVLAASAALAKTKPNIIVYFADDISAREFPIYGSSVWTAPDASDTSDPQYRAKMPVVDKLAEKGCWIETAWACTICNPSRAMMMSGRYAYRTKWWHNGDKGRGHDENGKLVYTWPVYMSSPILMGHAAQKAGYATYWAGKTQMMGRDDLHGFDEGCFTPGPYASTDNPYTDFRHEYRKVNGKKVLFNADTGKPCPTYLQNSWYWCPHVTLMNHPSLKGAYEGWWPNTPESIRSFGLGTYGPDVSLKFCFDFMERKQREGKPFLIYHTTHLGHDAFNWLDPDHKKWGKIKWPNTPIVKWDGKKYTRVEPNITGDNGEYDTHGSITRPGIHHHINYIDYQIWLYLKELDKLGIADNTVIIIAADNGTSGYGKASSERQKGDHVPMIIYAPGMTKHGKQEIMVSLADVMPTVAELCGYKFPADYKLDGKSLVPYLFTDQVTHRDWIYSYRGPEQMIRGTYVMKDGHGKWYDVSRPVDNLDIFKEIKDWGSVLETHREEREKLLKILPRYDNYFTEHDEPGVPPLKKPLKKKVRYFRTPND